MREIKFRVWTGLGMEYNVMAGWLGAFYVQGIDPKDSACMSPYNTIYSKSVHVMQFTNLLDKNGKGIYEADIIKAIGEESGEEIIVEVKWQDDGAAFYTHKIHGWPAVMIGEVIGNKFENPELLK